MTFFRLYYSLKILNNQVIEICNFIFGSNTFNLIKLLAFKKTMKW